MALPHKIAPRSAPALAAALALALALTLAACGDSSSKPASEPAGAQGAPAAKPAAAVPAGLIAYQTDRGGSEGVWLIRSDETDHREAATDVPDEHLHPDWSPDGSRLLFTKRTESKDLLYEADAEGRGAKKLLDCDLPCIGDDEASYSPDGRHVAFIRALGPLADERPTDCALWVLDRASGKARRLTRHRGCRTREAFPRWSPDGKTLVYFRDRTDKFNITSATAIFTLPLKGGKERRLTPWSLVAGDPDWSPDGKRIVFSTYPFVYFQGTGAANLYTMRPDGSDRKQLTSHGEDGPHLGHPRWTPDGRHILHVKDSGAARELWLMQPDGAGEVEIAGSGIYTHPVWRPEE